MTEDRFSAEADQAARDFAPGSGTAERFESQNGELQVAVYRGQDRRHEGKVTAFIASTRINDDRLVIASANRHDTPASPTGHDMDVIPVRGRSRAALLNLAAPQSYPNLVDLGEELAVSLDRTVGTYRLGGVPLLPLVDVEPVTS